LLTELLCKLLDFSALLCAVAPSVVHWAPQTILITTGGLSQPLVTMWAMAPPAIAEAPVTVGAPANDLLLPSAFFFFLLFYDTFTDTAIRAAIVV
jgi:hypothetical protein